MSSNLRCDFGHNSIPWNCSRGAPPHSISPIVGVGLAAFTAVPRWCTFLAAQRNTAIAAAERPYPWGHAIQQRVIIECSLHLGVDGAPGAWPAQLTRRPRPVDRHRPVAAGADRWCVIGLRLACQVAGLVDIVAILGPKPQLAVVSGVPPDGFDNGREVFVILVGQCPAVDQLWLFIRPCRHSARLVMRLLPPFLRRGPATAGRRWPPAAHRPAGAPARAVAVSIPRTRLEVWDQPPTTPQDKNQGQSAEMADKPASIVEQALGTPAHGSPCLRCALQVDAGLVVLNVELGPVSGSRDAGRAEDAEVVLDVIEERRHSVAVVSLSAPASIRHRSDRGRTCGHRERPGAPLSSSATR